MELWSVYLACSLDEGVGLLLEKLARCVCQRAKIKVCLMELLLVKTMYFSMISVMV